MNNQIAPRWARRLVERKNRATALAWAIVVLGTTGIALVGPMVTRAMVKAEVAR